MGFDTLLLDIEGTVCPISFVKDVLFPHFAAEVPAIVQSTDATIVEILSNFQINDPVKLQQHILDLVARDVKDATLKQLQGHVWATGYQSGQIKAPVYKDAIDLIKRKSKIFIYSSGSVKAQKLLFEFVADPSDYTKSIDLRPFIHGYFDINTSGKKIEEQSYKNILESIEMTQNPEQVLFLSDNPLELDAAKKAGLTVGLAIREGNAIVDNKSDYENYLDFSQL
ncbi:hypothetical protein KAFR_0E00520 [Kazachstania africana CBS 2517]|uniref:Enolase-phosphatase E1 n=1 Tax=Kazachstania africana (strain ATCC 22294 / BCRC 22015 / CBS 2517 / CECT 1963 / NBRC 1671 / NRRL Y-8276) TaxID=1071382 RepID=H2AV06_KAZAF|nr:hypothetical protein KAFR_0E00520 [Kazachstania africana CBS 2517]CCF58206.1 hypothetical protein KAFR_0E00520 [Kazachstania africana CBS 2517]